MSFYTMTLVQDVLEPVFETKVFSKKVPKFNLKFTKIKWLIIYIVNFSYSKKQWQRGTNYAWYDMPKMSSMKQNIYQNKTILWNIKIKNTLKEGILEEDFTFFGMLIAVCFFPLGIICCMLQREFHCSECSMLFKNSFFLDDKLN